MGKLLDWSDELSVSVRSCDNQHKRWIDITNEMHQAMAMGKGKETLSEMRR
jgi:hemerythrin